MKNEYRDMQKKLGCHGCDFASRKALRMGKTCCNYLGQVSVNSRGKCKNRKGPKPVRAAKSATK